MGSKSSGQTQLVEKFGGYWPEESIYTEEYITNDTVNVYLERHKNEIISGNKKTDGKCVGFITYGMEFKLM